MAKVKSTAKVVPTDTEKSQGGNEATANLPEPIHMDSPDRKSTVAALKKLGAQCPEVLADVVEIARSLPRLDGAIGEFRTSDGTQVLSKTIVGTERGLTIGSFTARCQKLNYTKKDDRVLFLEYQSVCPNTESAKNVDDILCPLSLIEADYVKAAEAIRKVRLFRRPDWYRKLMKAAREEGKALREAFRVLGPHSSICTRLGMGDPKKEWTAKAEAFAKKYLPSPDLEKELLREVQTVPTTGKMTRSALDTFEIHYQKEAGDAFLDAFRRGKTPKRKTNPKTEIETQAIAALVDVLKTHLPTRGRHHGEPTTWTRAAALLGAVCVRLSWRAVRNRCESFRLATK